MLISPSSGPLRCSSIMIFLRSFQPVPQACHRGCRRTRDLTLGGDPPRRMYCFTELLLSIRTELLKTYRWYPATTPGYFLDSPLDSPLKYLSLPVLPSVLSLENRLRHTPTTRRFTMIPARSKCLVEPSITSSLFICTMLVNFFN